MLLAQRYAFGRIVKPVWMFDSFEGLPPVGVRDGPSAAAWQSNTTSEFYFANCKAPLERVRDAARSFGFSDAEAIIVPGWFDDTLPSFRERFLREGIALLRVDCDWYDPVLCVMNELAPAVVDEGRILFDDYFCWDGCARALHDYLSKNDLPWRIRTIGRGDDVGAWMIKRGHRGEHQSS